MKALPLSRRATLAVGLAAVLGACTRAVRCATCGMRIDAKSPWRADLVTKEGLVHFDTPRCALTSWRNGRTAATSLLVSDFYDQRRQSADVLRFVAGSDVIGPMGAELVPVDIARSDKFMTDHHGGRSLRLEEITREMLASL